MTGRIFKHPTPKYLCPSGKCYECKIGVGCEKAKKLAKKLNTRNPDEIEW